jgi:electron transport complex protein RnfG
MAKRKSTFINMVLTLFVVSFVASTALGFIFELTKEPIAKARLEKKKAAIRLVTPEFSNNPIDDMYKIEIPDNDSLECYPSKNQNGELLGTAIKSYSDKAFNERIYIMVGFHPDGTIHNTSVLSHKETPGLGDKMNKKKSDWSNQFNGKNPESFKLLVTKDGGDIDAITAATISSRAYTEAVDKAYKEYKKLDQ